MKQAAVVRLAFARKDHPELVQAEAQARLELAAAIMTLDEAEDTQREWPGEKRIHSREVAHLREDLAAALRAGLDSSAGNDVDVQEIVERIQDARDTQSTLRQILEQLGPVIFGAIVLFSIEAKTSLCGDCEVLSRQSFLETQGLTFADLRQPADSLRPRYTDEAAPNTPAERIRIGIIRAAIAKYKSQQLPLKHTFHEQAAVEEAKNAYAQALADLIRGEYAPIDEPNQSN